MKDYIVHHEWKIIEEGFEPEYNRVSESLFSIGNGKMGQRANFEETYSGDSLRGAYIAGIYYPDKTRVGWWKNGYPEYFAKIINSANWIGIKINFDGRELDIAKMKVESFSRELDMQHGLLIRKFVASYSDNKKVQVEAKRFVSVAEPEMGAIFYSFRPLNFSGDADIAIYIDGDVYNEDSNYDEKFWKPVSQTISGSVGCIEMETLKTGFRVATAMNSKVYINGACGDNKTFNTKNEKYIDTRIRIRIKQGDTVTIEKFASTVTSLDYDRENLCPRALDLVLKAGERGFESLFESHKNRWLSKWKNSDIRIEGDLAAQQGIRYNIFQLNQTYTGEDERLNIGPKGFTGEKYGGVTYWDTEAYCLPFYLSTAPVEVARSLLIYRHKHLGKAIENGLKLGFNTGAALYPMVTINGEECHNEWEITFEEIHRNGAIAYGIYNYITYTGDRDYLAPRGFEVLLAISRFWSQRVNWSEQKQKYVMLGVTGPNEYENNVDNNFHTNYIAVWTLKFTLEVIEYLRTEFPNIWHEMVQKWKFSEVKETSRWKDIIENMYFPYDESLKLFMQQDGFLDKELIPVSEIDSQSLPINQNWSWDRILRSCYIKQADTLLSFFWFENDFTPDQHRNHFDFYESFTVHESSLSPCIHAILAARIGYEEKSYQMYLRTARLDLDDYNNDTGDGLHITSMGGTWMAFVMGFGGLRVQDNILKFNPFLPDKWGSYSFTLNFRGAAIHLRMEKGRFTAANMSGIEINLEVWGTRKLLSGNNSEIFTKM